MASTEEPTPRRKQLDDLIWLTGKSLTPTLLRNCEALITLVCHRLECPEDQNERLSHILQGTLTAVIAEKRREALEGFKRSRQAKRTLSLEEPAGQATLVAAFGELLGQSSEHTLRELASARDSLNALNRILENTKSRLERRQSLAGLWWPPGGLSARQVRRYVHDFKDGEPMWTASILDALDKYLRMKAVELQTQLAGLNTPANNGDDQPPSKPDEAEDDRYPPGYILRPDYHERFSQLLAEKYKYIVLSGLPGIGKSSLADALTRPHLPKGETAPIIEFIDREPTPESVEAALRYCSVGADPEKTWAQPKRYLSMLLHDNNAPKFLIFDNLDNLEGISQLLPPRGKSTVVITCRAATHLGRRHAVIPIDWMTEIEATALVKRYIPTLSDEDANLMGILLYGYPILIHHACILYARQSLPVSEFCTAIQADVANLADRVETTENKSLLVVLRHLVQLVKRDDQMAYDLLTCLSFAKGPVDRMFIIAYLEDRVGHQVTRILFTDLLYTLSRYSFIQSAEDRTGESGSFLMHNLTQVLMQPLLNTHSEEAAQTASRVYRRALKEFGDLTVKIDEDWLPPDFLEQQMSNFDESPGPTKRSSTVDYYHKQFKTARYVGNLIIKTRSLPKNLDDIQQYLARNPNKRIGTIMIGHFDPDKPMKIIDLDAESRPADGDKVEILGHKFTLMDARDSKATDTGSNL